jgi:hypothetical protein
MRRFVGLFAVYLYYRRRENVAEYLLVSIPFSAGQSAVNFFHLGLESVHFPFSHFFLRDLEMPSSFSNVDNSSWRVNRSLFHLADNFRFCFFLLQTVIANRPRP